MAMQTNCPSRRHNSDREHERRLHEFGHSRAETRADPKCADSPQHKARSEYEYEIECARHQNLHDSGLSPSAPGSLSMRLTRGARRTIGHEQSTSRIPRRSPL